tara:strand:+ start:149 stop:520 length:372 start_codon:yes stop_codon:yes gene_type:complete
MPKKDVKKTKSTTNIDKELLENFVSLQHVLTNLAVKFEDLSGNISRLLQLFELSAKSFADKPINSPGVDQEFLKKLDSLLDQNKTISKGIMMMEDRIRNRSGSMPSMPRPQQAVNRMPRPLPR